MSNKEWRERYHFLKERHICVRCGKRDAFYNQTKCPECIEKSKKETENIMTKQRADLAKKEKRNKALYARKKQKGYASNVAKRRQQKVFTA